MAQLLLKKAFEKKKKDFPKISVRWIARKLDISHVYLSYILKGQRPIPLEMVDPLCDVLDLDHESRSQIYKQIFKIQSPPAAEKSTVVRISSWNLVTVKDFDLISRWEPMAILMVTRLKEYDGSIDFIAERLDLPPFFVKSILNLLKEKSFLVESHGKLCASERFYEFQSQSSKKDIRKYHRSVVTYARNLMDNASDQKSLVRRHIVSGAFTCSEDDVPRMKIKINDFIRDCIADCAPSDPENVYQLAVQFFPVTKKKT